MTTSLLALGVLLAQVAQSPEETARGMKVPEGFTVQLFAGEPDIVQPVSFAIDDRGRLWVAEMLSYPKWEPRDRITVLEDSGGTGKFDKRTVFIEGLTYITGIEVGFGGVWVMAPPRMLFIPIREGELKPAGPPEVLLDGFGLQGGHNIANGFTWGPDGWLYAGHGRTSISDVGRPGCRPEERIHFDGGVFRYHPTRRVFEPWCDGTTNPWGVAFDELGQAFISTCVDVHLYHAIQGGKFEPWRGRESSRFAYGRIPSIADHKHWAGASIDASRGGKADTLAAGGGHAHCGMMVYLGDTFPDSYRGAFFMNNLHGHRVNEDLPRRSGSGFVASHGPDFMVSSDPMHLGLLLAYGPDGGVFVSDWYDRGECHTRDPDRGTGRIYKITYRGTPPRPVDLGSLPSDELVGLQLHPNDWFVTHARRLLQERGSDPKVQAALLKIFTEHPDRTRRLRALWALHVTGGLTPDVGRRALSDPEEYIRAWAIQLEMERGTGPLPRLAQMAREDPSPVVRLYLASASARMALRDRWEILRGLAAHGEDQTDPNLPLMIWYAAEPMAEEDAALALGFVREARIPLLREFMARRLSGIAPPPLDRTDLPSGTIAVASSAPRGWELCLFNRDTGKERTLAGSPGPDFGGVFSPDGERLAWVSGREGSLDLYTARSNGTDLRRLSRGFGLDAHPAWSPDSQQILFASTREARSEPGQSWSALYLMRADGKGVERLSPPDASDFSPAWSWWGDLVAFASGTGRAGSTDLYTMKPDGSDRKRVVRDGGWPTFAAGSRRIYFHSRRDGVWGIWRVDADGTGLTRITPREVEAWTPRALRSNLMAVSARHPGRPWEVELIDLDTGTMTPLAPEGRDQWQPCLSPDGRTVVYHRRAAGPEIISIEPLGSPAPALRLLKVPGHSPAFSPDGKRLALVSPGGAAVSLIPMDGSGPFSFYRPEVVGSIRSLQWIRDPDEIGILEGALMVLRPEPGARPRGVERTGDLLGPVISPDGRQIAFTRRDEVGAGHLSVRNVGGGAVRRLSEGAGMDVAGDWSPDGRSVAFSSDRNGSWEIWRVGADGTGLRKVVGGATPEGRPRFSPDGRWIVFVSDRAGLSLEEAGQPEGDGAELYAIRPDGTGLLRLSYLGYPRGAPTWGPGARNAGR